MSDGKVFVKIASYQQENLKAAFVELMDLLGGRRIGRGTRVLIKPNLLSPAPPARAILTHPGVVREAVEYVLKQGGTPLVADSPAIGSFSRVLKAGGIEAALEGLAVEARGFKRVKAVDFGPPLGKVELAADALEAEVIINLPKLKSHGQMLLTLGVKNMFGCVVGFKKPEWHMKMGPRRDLFAELLVKIYEETRPAFNILDGILALEGEGPGRGGRPKPIGVLMAGASAHALDLAVCRLIRIDPSRLPTVRAAERLGLLPDRITIEGELPRVEKFQLPVISPLIYGPERLHNLVRRHLLQMPVADPGRCTLCGECGNICPANAVSARGKGIVFDLGACIRCYCCQEICPEGAIKIREPLAGRIARKLFRKVT